MRRALTYAAIAAGIAFGVWHVVLAVSAMFVFRQNEPVTSWLAVGLGPTFTLIGTVVALANRLLGGVLLLIAAGVATLAFVIGEGGVGEYLAPYLLTFTAPMAALGVTFVALGRMPSGRGHAT